MLTQFQPRILVSFLKGNLNILPLIFFLVLEEIYRNIFSLEKLSVPTYSSFVPWKGILLLYQTTIQIYSEIGTSSFLFQIVFWLWTGSFASILLREKY